MAALRPRVRENAEELVAPLARRSAVELVVAVDEFLRHLLDRLPPSPRPGAEVEYAPHWAFHGPSRLTLTPASPP
ncbi:hypothetical protein ACFW96_15235 [Streptomyces gardneri]|uniref:hypothetical protein n=1 Tax=Streptomyces gardneri TaxID=66892 RepID=UPI0036BFA5C1